MTETQKYRRTRRVRKFQAQRRKYRRSRFLFFALLGEAVLGFTATPDFRLYA